VSEIDHFESPARARAEAAIKAAQGRVRDSAAREMSAVVRRRLRCTGGTWVTRAGIFVDRIGSAWLIRRFIDTERALRVRARRALPPKKGEVRFDMFEAEYTHEGDRCTFEVLLARFGLHDPALTRLSEIVHDIDLKDEKFGRPETPGVAAVLGGIAATTNDDAARLEQGAALFDGLYTAFGGSARAGK
jgi:hypothetical protein